MSERDIGKDRVLPSFYPAWNHPSCPHPWREDDKDVIVSVDGGFWRQEALTVGSEPIFTSVRREIIGFRLVRQST